MMTGDIQSLINRGAMFYCSHSGGKDSQAMYALMSQEIPADQIVVIHADLGEIEWTGVQAHIGLTVNHNVNVVRAGKTFFDMVEHRYAKDPARPCWPSSSVRQCTSDLKRGPIYKFIRNDLKSRGKLLAVNCMGLRAEESPGRAKKPTLAINKMLSKAGREIHDWLPVHDLLTAEIFEVIRDAGQQPFWAYERNERLSCVFCIFGSDNDLQHGAKQRPELAQKYIDIEQRTGWTMFHKTSLASRLGLEK